MVKALGKSPVICRSSPGFLVTRVLFFYLNEAVRLWEQSLSAVAIDGAMRDFGWPMGPLRLIDEVGVDVTDFIFGELQHYFHDRFVRTNACTRMLAAGLRGRKNGTSRGFYRYEGRTEGVNDAETLPLAGARSHELAGDERQRVEVTKRLMHVMVDEARRCLDEGVVKSPDDVDFALLSGAGFPAFRGGLMHWAAAARAKM
jgi:3-hydroxyacyl-CoA dehydrogenase/enoyl-CoA hydratase/3-hydroxybutyryl-CoA epimerase